MLRRISRWLMAGMMLATLWPAAPAVADIEYTVMVVTSRETGPEWASTMEEGVRQAVGSLARLVFIDLDAAPYAPSDAKAGADGPADLPAKDLSDAELGAALQARFRQLSPDGVIAAGDRVQTVWVAPHLREKAATPVMFCGVRDDPTVWGYPAANVSGIRERPHVGEAIAMMKQLLPQITAIGYLAADTPVGRALMDSIGQRPETFPVRFGALQLASDLPEALRLAAGMRQSCDALLLAALDGLSGPAEGGAAVAEETAVSRIHGAFGKPMIGTRPEHVRAGALCGVAPSGAEQGRIAGQMLMAAIGGTPLSQLPIQVNRNGERMINLSAMRKLGIRPRPELLKGCHLMQID